MRLSLPIIGQLKIDENFRDIVAVLKKLTFADNFDCFEVTLTIDASSEKQIENSFPSKLLPIPKSFLITQHIGNGLIVKGDTPWTKDFVYLKNISSTSSATITAVFL